MPRTVKREPADRDRRLKLADDVVTAFLGGDRETYVKALELRNCVVTEAPPDPGLLGDLHDALRKAVLMGASRRVLSDFETVFEPVSAEEGARAAVVWDPQPARLEATEEACEVLKALGSESIDKARYLRTLLNEGKLPQRDLVSAVGETLLDALMTARKKATGPGDPESPGPEKLREVYKKLQAAFGDLLG